MVLQYYNQNFWDQLIWGAKIYNFIYISINLLKNIYILTNKVAIVLITNQWNFFTNRKR